MCKVYVILGLGMLFLGLQGKAQNPPQVIKPFVLGISNQKTTNLIFPFEIKSVDRGSGAILAQKAKGVSNVLQIKADTGNFQPTNLTVITSDAGFYSFLLSFAIEPTFLNLRFGDSPESSPASALLEDAFVNEKSYNNLLGWVSHEKPFLRKRKQANRLRLWLRNIYIVDSVLAFGLQLTNTSDFLFRPSRIKFYIQTGGKGKRTVHQEREINPIYPPKLPAVVGANGQIIAIGFKPFTFYNTQQLIIQVEETGGRMIELPVKLKTLLKAKTCSVK